MTFNNYDILPGKITRFDITNKKTGRSINALQLIGDFSYYESIVKPAITMNITLIETGSSVEKDKKQLSVLDGLPLRGGEIVEIEFSDGKNPENKISLTGDSALYVNVIGNIIQDSQKLLYNIHLCSKEYLINDSIFVEKCFQGKLSEAIKLILTDDLKTKKPISIDESINSQNIFGHQRHPLHLCSELARVSIPNLPNAQGITAGYFFYETADGYNFKSIDGLLSKSKSSKKYIQNNTDGYPLGFDGKILNHRPSRTINVKQQLKNGTYGIETALFNADKFQTSISDLKIDKQKTSVNPAGKDYDFLPDELRKTTLKVYGSSDNGQSPKGTTTKEKLDSYEKNPDILNFDMPNIIAQGRMRFNQLYTQKFDVTMPGDYSLRAGQTIDCTFPSSTAETNKEKDESISGIYIIESLHHTVTADRQSLTYLTIVRDSFGSTP